MRCTKTLDDVLVSGSRSCVVSCLGRDISVPLVGDELRGGAARKSTNRRSGPETWKVEAARYCRTSHWILVIAQRGWI